VAVTTIQATLQAADDAVAYTFRMPSEDVSYRVSTKSNEASSMTITSAGENGTVQVSFTKLEQNAMLMTAFYDEDGRLVGSQGSAVSAGAAGAKSTATLTGTPAFVRVFVLDPTTRKPLLESKRETI